MWQKKNFKKNIRSVETWILLYKIRINKVNLVDPWSLRGWLSSLHVSEWLNRIGQTEKPRRSSIAIGRTFPGRFPALLRMPGPACLNSQGPGLHKQPGHSLFPTLTATRSSSRKKTSANSTSAKPKLSRVPYRRSSQAEDPVVEAGLALWLPTCSSHVIVLS